MAGEKITILDLVDSLAARNHCSRAKAETFLRKSFSLIKDGLNRDEFVKVKGLGSFKLVTVSSRQSVDVNTGERIEISEHQRLLFTPDASLKARVNRAFEKFETIILEDEAEISDMESEEENVSDSEQTTNTIEKESNEEIQKPNAVVPKASPIKPAVQPKTVAETVSVPQEPTNENSPEVVSLYIGKDSPKSEMPNIYEVATDDENETGTVETSAQQVAIEPDFTPEIVPSEPVSSADDEIVSADDETTDEDEDTEEPNTHSVLKRVLLILLILVLMIGSFCAGYYRVIEMPTWFSETNTEQVPAKSVVIPTEKKVAAPVKAKVVDSLAQAKQTPKPTEPTPYEKSKKYEQLPDGDFLIVGTLETHIMKETDTLLKLSRKVYGSKNYVKYIVFYNHLENADMISLGMELKLPELVHKQDAKAVE